jgi:hypothetical protein
VDIFILRIGDSIYWASCSAVNETYKLTPAAALMSVEPVFSSVGEETGESMLVLRQPGEIKVPCESKALRLPVRVSVEPTNGESKERVKGRRPWRIPVIVPTGT